MLYNPKSLKSKIVRMRKNVMGGSILLDKGGAGVGSSYPSMEEYHRITGRGVLADKLKALLVKPIEQKKKNIKFNF
jgi:hypothetical protein